MVKHLPTMQDTWVRSLGGKDPLEKEMATHSSTLAWKTPWTEEPCRLQLVGSQRVGHNWATSLSLSLNKCAALQPLGTTVPASSLLSHLPCCSTHPPSSASCAYLHPWPPCPLPSSPAAATTTALLQGVKWGSDSALGSSPTPSPLPTSQSLGNPGWGGPCWLTHTTPHEGLSFRVLWPRKKSGSPGCLWLCHPSGAPPPRLQPLLYPHPASIRPQDLHPHRPISLQIQGSPAGSGQEPQLYSLPLQSPDLTSGSWFMVQWETTLLSVFAS